MHDGEGFYTFVRKKKISFQWSALDKLILDFVETGIVFPDLQNQLLVDDTEKEYTTPWSLLKKWRKELVKWLILRHSLADKNSLQKTFRILAQHSFWEGCQILVAYRALISHFLGIQIDPFIFHQTDGGAAALEIEGMWKWGDIPHLHIHAELGVIWALIGHHLNRADLNKAALKIAEWQLNTLDYDFRPFQGFFVRENDANFSDLLILNYLLFRSAALISRDKKWSYAAHKQLAFLAQVKNIETELSTFALVIDFWVNLVMDLKESEPFLLPSNIYEPSTCLAGKRNKDHSILSTLYGGGTGMGTFHAGHVRVLSYGPQWLPLGDCSGFGLEGGLLSHKCSPYHIHSDDNSFTQDRLVRLASMNPKLDSHANFRNGKQSEIWMKAKQQFSNQELTIETSFTGLQNNAPFAFVFFIEGKTCQIGENKKLYPRTFSRYEGLPQPIVVNSSTSSLNIHPLFKESTMQVIPLAGEKSFWGADFLVAYTIESLHYAYKWNLNFKT